MAEQVTIIREARLDPTFPLSRQELRELVLIILEALGLDGDSVEIKLIDDEESSRLNAEFMHCNGPTNILSFPAEDEDENLVDSDTPVYLGELALSVDTLAREADLYGQPPVLHLARLLAHGLLHLDGFDHGDEMYDLTDTAVDRVELEFARDKISEDGRMNGQA